MIRFETTAPSMIQLRKSSGTHTTPRSGGRELHVLVSDVTLGVIDFRRPQSTRNQIVMSATLRPSA